MDVLQLDVSGRPQAWLSARDAALLYATDEVAWTIGGPFVVLRGGIQRHSGLPSRLPLHPIVAVRGSIPNRAWRQEPALSNPKLFARDRHLCAYCGQLFARDLLTRDHVMPLSRNGKDDGGKDHEAEALNEASTHAAADPPLWPAPRHSGRKW